MWAVLGVSLLLLLVSPSGVHSEDARQLAGSGPDLHWDLFKPDQIQWRDGPPSLLPGAKMAILEGDPAKEGFFTMRLKLPDGYRVFPHWHPRTERLTIIQGIVNLGTGDRFDTAATQTLSAGAYSSVVAREKRRFRSSNEDDSDNDGSRAGHHQPDAQKTKRGVGFGWWLSAHR